MTVRGRLVFGGATLFAVLWLGYIALTSRFLSLPSPGPRGFSFPQDAVITVGAMFAVSVLLYIGTLFDPDLRSQSLIEPESAEERGSVVEPPTES